MDLVALNGDGADLQMPIAVRGAWKASDSAAAASTAVHQRDRQFLREQSFESVDGLS